MSLRATGTLHENGKAAMPYLAGDLVQDAQFPLSIGGEFTAQIIPHNAVVLVPAAVDIDYPETITLRDPAQYQNQAAMGDGL